MIWSYYASRTFRKCQRQWYFKNCLAHHAAKHPIRREAYLLSKLQSIAAWRGSIVDEVISRRLVPALNQNRNVNQAYLLDFSRQLFKAQLEFAKQHRLREPDMKPSKAGDNFAAFHSVEYSDLKQEDIEQAWIDIENAFDNLFQMNELLERLRTADYLIAQRMLVFPFYEGSVRAVPDLIAFYRNDPPLILDWKVHKFGTVDYRTQLAVYAIALFGVFDNKPHVDFPSSLAQYRPPDTHLLEVQLLTNRCHRYMLSEEDVAETESYIAYSMEQMLKTKGTQNNNILRPFDFDVTRNPDNCARCPFRKICWEEELWLN